MSTFRMGALVASLVLAVAACDDDDPATNTYVNPSFPGGTGGTAGAPTGGVGSTGGGTTGAPTGGTGMTSGMITPVPGGMTGNPVANPGGNGAMDGGTNGANPGGGDGGATTGGDGGATTGDGGAITGDGGATTGDGGATTGGDGGATTGGPLVASCESGAETLPLNVAPPIVFVHGFAGSAQQYESQAMRFAANGYPLDRIYALDHDGEGLDTAAFTDQLDALVEKARTDHGVDKVFLVGHSRGTFVSSEYLWNADRAPKVAKYISLDGLGCLLLDVPCLEPSQSSLNGQAHVEVATSAESFKAQFEFLVGKPPTVVDLVAQQAPVEISGRAVNFPANTGRAGAKLEIWQLDAATGHRIGAPMATFNISESGDFGPVVVEPTKHYEFLLSGSEGTNHHFYPQPFLRCNKLVRLLSGPSDSPSRQNTNKGPDHAAVVAMRMREWRQADVLEVKTARPGAEQPVVNAIAATVNDAIALFLHDDTATPKQSSRSELTAMTGPFQTGVDVYMPAANPPDGTITFTNMPRGDTTKPQVIRTPNWPSTDHLISVMFSDFPHQ
jgi:pimeloyl-ACP methyl ester carboxylesterase